MFDFGIGGYRPRWVVGAAAVGAYGDRLRALAGRRLTRTWLVWDVEGDEWFADCPVLLDFEGEQVEVDHARLDDLSITWNTVDPAAPVRWPGFTLCRRPDAHPAPNGLRGRELRGVDLLERKGCVDVRFRFDGGDLTVLNALDENELRFDPAPADRRRDSG
ncbi:hypothetical protein [Nocardiopsis sp. NPDC057823]|uniref:hypothetical protein n=1 Tax=Nocardiopsis sp. NPDC057823 TaxID=3346256 RepID=UPI00366F05FE